MNENDWQRPDLIIKLTIFLPGGNATQSRNCTQHIHLTAL